MAQPVTVTKHIFLCFSKVWQNTQSSMFKICIATEKSQAWRRHRVQMLGNFLMNLQPGFENELSLLYDHNSKHFKTLVAPLHFSKLNTVSTIWRFSIGMTITLCSLKIASPPPPIHLWKRNYFWPRDLLICNTDVILWEWPQMVAQAPLTMYKAPVNSFYLSCQNNRVW